MDSKWRWFVMVAVYATNFIGSITSFSAGIIYAAILERYGGDKAKAAAVLSLNCGLLNVLGPITTLVVSRFSCRVSLVIGGVVLAISGLLSAFAGSVDVLMITYGILGGIGNSLTLVPANLILCFYFKNHRNLLISISNGMIGLAFFLASPVTMYLLEKYALSGTFIIFGALNIHICIAGMISRPSLLEIQAKESKGVKMIKLNKDFLVEKSKLGATKVVAMALRNIPGVSVSFIFFLLSTTAWTFVISVCMVHLPTFALVNGFGKEEITLLMTCLSICNTIGRLLPALTVAKSDIDITLVHTVVLGLMGIIAVTFPSFSSFRTGTYVFAASVGLFTGLPNSLMTPITIRIVGLERLSISHGFTYFSCGIGILLGPTIAGLLYGMTNSYNSSFIFIGVISITGCGFAFASRCLMSPQTKPIHEVFAVQEEKEVTSKFLESDIKSEMRLETST